jgi:hypothetical protein
VRRRLLAVVAGALFAAPAALTGGAHAQDLARHVRDAAPDATIRFSYPARPGVCGSGDDAWIRSSRDQTVRSLSGGGGIRVGSGRGTAGEQCEPGPVYLELGRSGGRITDVSVRVGESNARAAVDWYRTDAAAAAAFLLAEHVLADAGTSAARQMVFAAAIADTETWPQLLVLARSRTAVDETRKSAIFWLGQAAGDRIVAGLESLAADDSDELAVRETAIFALSQIASDEAISTLLEIARSNTEPRIRRSALFWLARSATPAAVALFEEILRGG